MEIGTCGKKESSGVALKVVARKQEGHMKAECRKYQQLGTIQERRTCGFWTQVEHVPPLDVIVNYIC